MSKFKLRQAALISWSVALVGSVLIMISPLLGSEARFPALGGGVGLLVVGAVIYGSHGLWSVPEIVDADLGCQFGDVPEP